jgi:hypothetical protein
VSKAEVRFRAPGPVAAAFLQSSAFVQVIRGPVGSAKTTTICFKILRLMSEQKPDANGLRQSLWIITRATYPELCNTTIRDWQRCTPTSIGSLKMSSPPTWSGEWDLPDGTRAQAEVIFLALDRPDDVKKALGINATAGWLNEAKEFPKSVVDALTARMDRFPKPGASNWAGLLADTNAWDADHWLQDLAIKVQLGEVTGYDFFTQPPAMLKREGRWGVNPQAENLKIITPAYYERVVQGKKEDWIKVYLGNEVGLALDGKPVHADYSESVHVAPTALKPTKGIPLQFGCDWGLTPCSAIIQRQATGQWWVLDEIVTDGMGAERFALELKAKFSRYQGFEILPGRGDPSGDQRAATDEKTVFQVVRAGGVNVLPASTNDVSLRRAALERPLTRMVGGKPGILISPNCTVLRKALAGAFRYRRVQIAGEERYRDEPDKVHPYSDIVEALEYGLIDAGEKATVNVVGAPLAASRPVVHRSTWSPFEV